MDLQAAARAAAKAVEQIDAKVKTKLMKRARRQGMTNEGEVTALVQAWKQAAKHTKRLHLGHGHHNHKGH
jgi:hypothetical protein